MKSIFSLAALLIALGFTAMLVKKQLSAVTPPAPASAGAPTSPTPATQVQQVGQQVQSLMQQPRTAASEP